MFRVMTKCDKNGKFVPALHKVDNHYDYWVAEDYEDGTRSVLVLSKQDIVENSHLFGNIRVFDADRAHPTIGSLLVTPVFSLDSMDLNAFDMHFKKGYERYIKMPNRNQAELFEEYSNNLDLGDFLIKEFVYRPLIKALCMHRGDVFSSDREVAAMAYAVRNMIF